MSSSYQGEGTAQRMVEGSKGVDGSHRGGGSSARAAGTRERGDKEIKGFMPNYSCLIERIHLPLYL